MKGEWIYADMFIKYSSESRETNDVYISVTTSQCT